MPTDYLQQFRGVTLHQLGALRQLEAGPLAMHELARRLGVGASSATQLVDRLMNHGLVERIPDPGDRRLLRVSLTPSAAQAVKEFKEHRRHQLTALLAPLTDAELQTFVDLAERMLGDPVSTGGTGS